VFRITNKMALFYLIIDKYTVIGQNILLQFFFTELKMAVPFKLSRL